MAGRMSRQLDLFGDPGSGKAAGAIGPAAVSDDDRRAAAALPRNLRFGTSSWSFPGWQGIVFDRAAAPTRLARQGLAAYARHPLLRAVGIDRTFYAPVSTAVFAEYAAAVPEDFRFLVKAASAVTTPRDRATRAPNRLFLDAGYATAEVVAPFVEGLEARAGALLFQFPPVGGELRKAPEAFADRLADFLGRLPRGPAYAVELRDRELLSDRYFDALEAAAVSHCHSIHPRLPAIADQRAMARDRAGQLVVARWMLHSGLQYEEAVRRYEPFSRLVDEDAASRESLADLCATAARRGRSVILTANNKAEGSAPLSIFRLAAEVARRLG